MHGDNNKKCINVPLDHNEKCVSNVLLLWLLTECKFKMHVITMTV